MLSNSVYKNRTVLITGHSGFKGSWLAIWLKEFGADVIGYSLGPPSQPSNFQATQLQKRITDIHGDIRDFDQLMNAFKTHKPEFVFHLAAQPIVRLSYDEPKPTFDTNIGGTVNVLEAVRKTPSVKVLINVSSDKCYENKEWIWGYRENDPLGGYDPYSSSKGCAELVFSAYLRSFFSHNTARDRSVGAASVRAGNVIGGGDWGADRLVPDCIRALSRCQPIDIRNSHAVRPWQHVLEPLGAYLLLGTRLSQDPRKYSGAWNFGPDANSHLAVSEMADGLINHWGYGSWNDLSEPQTLHEAQFLKLNCDKAHSELGWHNVLTTNECLQMTSDWYKAYYAANQNMEAFGLCLSQIYEYMEKASTRGAYLGLTEKEPNFSELRS